MKPDYDRETTIVLNRFTARFPEKTTLSKILTITIPSIYFSSINHSN